jgi:hypothetical protein
MLKIPVYSMYATGVEVERRCTTVNLPPSRVASYVRKSITISTISFSSTCRCSFGGLASNRVDNPWAMLTL